MVQIIRFLTLTQTFAGILASDSIVKSPDNSVRNTFQDQYHAPGAAIEDSTVFMESDSIYAENGIVLLGAIDREDAREMMGSYLPSSNSSIFSSFRRRTTERLSAQFQIKSTEKFVSSTGEESDICLQAQAITVGSKIITQKCVDSRTSQQWTVDEYGRYHTVNDENLCISNGAQNSIILSNCGTQGLRKNMFVLNAFENTINWRNNGIRAVSVVGDEPKLNKYINIARHVLSKNMQEWRIEPSPLFISKEDVPSDFHIKSLSTSTCLEMSPSAALVLNTCEAPNSNQMWNVNEFGILSSSGDSSKCIVVNSDNNLVIGSCQKTNNNMFMFDATDSSLVWKRNGSKAFSTDSQGNVELKRKIPSNMSQMWSLEAISGSIVEYVGNPCTDFSPNGQCEVCTGDCDADSDCETGLRCAKRRRTDGLEIVPGCAWGNDDLQFGSSDYCFLPISQPGVMNYVGECGSSYKCGLCEGDCDSDDDCEGDLVCVSRNGFEAVSGCSGEGGNRDMYDKDVCAPSPTPTPPTPTPPVSFLNSLTYNNDGCTSDSPCSKCEGPCTNDSSCSGDLVCFTRSGSEPVPGCVTGSDGDISGTNYCYEEPLNGMPTYVPGDLTRRENGLLLSTGLRATVIATTGSRVTYTGPSGGRSSSSFHGDPDAAAVFSVTSGPNAGGWIYASNAERSDGGVGAITFNSDGQVINYEMILTGTSDNCGGGKTYWGTWVTCEENGSRGQVWEVNPSLSANSQRSESTVLGGSGGNYESFAYDARDRSNPTFYVTNDSSRGGMVRFTPNPGVVAEAERTGDYSEVLYTMGTLEWLVLQPDNGSINDVAGTFTWTSSRSTGDGNANSFYQYSEGIDVRNGYLYFVTKTSKSLYILDLDNGTYERSSTVSGAFDGQPDQVKRIISEDPSSDMLYFCEEASSDNGIHARDSEGNFYTIIDSDTLRSETTGLAFSPDKKHMYVSYQSDGIIFDITREDGYPFGAHRLDIKYHAS